MGDDISVLNFSNFYQEINKCSMSLILYLSFLEPFEDS